MVLDSEKPEFLTAFRSDRRILNFVWIKLKGLQSAQIGIDKTGNLYVADTGGKRLLKISPTGDLLGEWKNEDGGLGFSQLLSVDIASDGLIYIVDPNGLIWKLLPDGKFYNWPAVAPVDTATGSHIGISSNNIIYVTDPENRRVLSFTTDGQPSGQLLPPEESQSLFSKPVGLAIGRDDTLYISDNIACRILAFKLTKP